MIRFQAKLIIIDEEKETSLNFNINAESPEDAVPLLIKKQEGEWPRSVDIGDCLIITNPDTQLNVFFILDFPDLTPKRVKEPEFNFWREFVCNNPTLKKLGIDTAVKNILPILDDAQKGVHDNGSCQI